MPSLFYTFILLVLAIVSLLLSFCFAQTFTSFSTSNSSWHPSQNRTLISPDKVFSAGFKPSKNTSQSLFIFSIWYTNISSNDNHPVIIWSANWRSPVHALASLIITSHGGLKLINGSSGPTIWNISTTPTSNNTILHLTNNGCLVFGSWKSFDHPTDTALPGQILNNTLSSNDGKFTFLGSKKLIFNGSDTYKELDNALLSLGIDGKVTKDGGGTLLTADFGSNRTRILNLGDDGNLRILSFNEGKWVVVWEALLEICEVHGLCGSGFICYSNGSSLSNYECVCPPGLKRSLETDSCVHKRPIKSPENSKFLRLDYVNYSSQVSSQKSIVTYSLKNCTNMCMVEHKCVGFGFKFDGLGYCVLLMDTLKNGYWSPNTEMSFYLRVDQSERDVSNFTGMSMVLNTTCPTLFSLPNPSKKSNKTTLHIIIVTLIFGFEIASGAFLFRAFLKRYVKYRDMAQTLGLGLLPTAGPKRFTYAEIKSATNDFSQENIIGKGAFSDVYAGKLQDGRPVAVKCLKNVTGGDTEFWGEVTIIARMHHLNLVRLWGFCNEKGKRILIYEHVPNGSLNKYLFKPNQDRLSDQDNEHDTTLMSSNGQRPLLDWNVRYRIALGVARAIAYLHEECLEWVLHCDIKPENILLGDDFCPKVADFGLSKLRKKDKSITKSAVHGTRGYLAPEWANNDRVTSKVDVFSFGMVLLEIVAGVRNTIQGPLSMPSEDWYFPKWAYEIAIEEKRMDMILDRQIKHCYDDKVHFELIDRMVKTAMWCVQERPETRPSMGKVAKMLEGTVEIIEPPKPTLFFL